MQILSIDIGTSSVKAGIFSDSGRLDAFRREDVSFRSPGEHERGLAQRWLDAIERIARRIASGSRIDAIAISGNGPTIVPIDRTGAPCGPVLHWIDRREVRIPQSRSYFLPKIAWLKTAHPAQYETAKWFLSCPEYLIFTLTGVAATINPNPEFTPYIWDDSSVADYRIDGEKLPPFLNIGERVGTVTALAARRFSLPKDTPVYGGGPDFLMCLLGTATVRAGRTCDRAGTSEGINYCSEARLESEGLRTLPHVIPGLYNVAGILSSTGRIFEWFRRISGQHEKSYDQMLSEISAVVSSIRNPVFLPSIHRGATWEFDHAAFMGLEAHHGIAEMGKAVVDSIGFSIRDLIETLEANGCPVTELRVSGGQARNRVWNQMKADMTGKAVVVPEIIDAELLGNVAAARTGMNEYDSLSEAAEALYRPVRRFEPRIESSIDDEYRRFCELRSLIVERLMGLKPNDSISNSSTE